MIRVPSFVPYGAPPLHTPKRRQQAFGHQQRCGVTAKDRTAGEDGVRQPTGSARAHPAIQRVPGRHHLTGQARPRHIGARIKQFGERTRAQRPDRAPGASAHPDRRDTARIDARYPINPQQHFAAPKRRTRRNTERCAFISKRRANPLAQHHHRDAPQPPQPGGQRGVIAQPGKLRSAAPHWRSRAPVRIDYRRAAHLGAIAQWDCGGYGAQGRDRTADTAIFSRMLYQLSYLGKARFAREGGLLIAVIAAV